MENAFDGLDSKLDKGEGRVRELADMPMTLPKLKDNEKGEWKKKE